MTQSRKFALELAQMSDQQLALEVERQAAVQRKTYPNEWGACLMEELTRRMKKGDVCSN